MLSSKTQWNAFSAEWLSSSRASQTDTLLSLLMSTPFLLRIVLSVVFDFPGLKALWKLLRTHSRMGERSRRTSRLCCSETIFFRKPMSDWEGDLSVLFDKGMNHHNHRYSKATITIWTLSSIIIVALIDQILFITFNSNQNDRTLFLSRLALTRVNDLHFRCTCAWWTI